MKILKSVYKTFISTLPFSVLNVNIDSPLHATFKIMPKNLYINYKLNSKQRHALNSYVHSINPKLSLEPVKINIKEKSKYYLSLNIYNCNSSIFSNNNCMTRIEINTYVNDGLHKGTFIIDSLSIDPKKVCKNPEYFKCNSGKTENIFVNTTVFFSETDPGFYTHPDLSKYIDYIYYSHGIYDKLYYDSYAILKIPKIQHLDFTFINISFQQPESIFYFKDSISFISSTWDNNYTNLYF